MNKNTENSELKTIMTDSPISKQTRVSVIIIDDDHASVEVLRAALEQYPYVDILATAYNLDEGRTLLRKLKPDLAFLDIEFPDGSGLDLFNNGQTWGHTHFVFYTVYSKYFHEAFRLRAYDYLLKPFDPQEVGLILERYRLEGRLPGVTAAEVASKMP